MDWTDWLWVSTQLSIVTFSVVGILASLVFLILGIQIIVLINKSKKYAEKKAEQVDSFAAHFTESFAENAGKTASIIAPLAGLGIGIFGGKKQSLFSKIVSSLFSK